jgi:hypothetical protein
MFVCFFKKIFFFICIAPTQPFRVALGAESRVCYLGNTAGRQPQWALAYCYLSQSSPKENERLIHCHSVFKPATFGMLAHLSDRLAKSHPLVLSVTCTSFCCWCRIPRSDWGVIRRRDSPTSSPTRSSASSTGTSWSRSWLLPLTNHSSNLSETWNTLTLPSPRSPSS